MATSYGFFNSISGDRVYNADDVNTFLEGLISPSGIYANLDDMLQVTAGSGVAVEVGAGKAQVKHHWFRSTAAESIALAPAHQVLNRYDAVVLRLDLTERSVGFAVITGTAATTPTAPAIIRNDSFWDLRLANVYIPAGASRVLQTNIQDTRLTAECGLITGLITQLDTSSFAAQLNAWMAAQTAAFEAWFETLTEDLNVNTYLQQYSKRATGGVLSLANIPLDMTGYVYDEEDVLIVAINGFLLHRGTDYDITTGTGGANPVLRIHFTSTASQTNNAVSILAIKSKIGDAPQQGITRGVIAPAADDSVEASGDVSNNGTNEIAITATIQEV